MYRIFTTLFFIIITLQSNFLLSQNYLYKKPSRDGIGKIYQGREISRIMGHFGAAWLERKSRSVEENPQLAVNLLDLSKNSFFLRHFHFEFYGKSLKNRNNLLRGN